LWGGVEGGVFLVVGGGVWCVGGGREDMGGGVGACVWGFWRGAVWNLPGGGWGVVGGVAAGKGGGGGSVLRGRVLGGGVFGGFGPQTAQTSKNRKQKGRLGSTAKGRPPQAAPSPTKKKRR